MYAGNEEHQLISLEGWQKLLFKQVKKKKEYMRI